MSTTRTVRLKILRQDSPSKPQTKRWEEFEVPWLPQMNVISALMEIQRSPKTTDGKTVAPVVWESSCLEEVCGACTMIVNGRVRQACTAFVDRLGGGETITLEPMTKFPLVRDLVVDRSRMFDDLKQVKAWIDLDGSHELGPGPRQSPANQEEAYPLSRCMTCGCCLEACPQVHESSPLVGPAAINQVRLFNLHPSGDRATRVAHGRGRRGRLRQGAELRGGLPQGDPARRLDRPGVTPGDETHALRLAAEVGAPR
jgi:succinate dehydrogenase / fumarate reductase iron-sulfur subunit